MKDILKIICFLIIVGNNTYAQNQANSDNALSLNLQQAVEYALQNNPDILNAKLDVIIAKKKVWETTAIGLPQVNASANYTNIFDVPVMNFGGYIDWQAIDPATPLTSGIVLSNYVEGQPIELGTKENIIWDITISQLIFSGEYIVGLQAAKVFKLLSAQNLKKTENDIIEAVNQTYYLILMAEENKKILDKSIENTKKIYEDLKKTFEAGFIESTNVDQIELTYKNLENSLKSVERQIELSYQLMKLQLGISNDTTIVLTDNLNDIVSKINIDAIISSPFDIENNIDYKLLDTRHKLSELTLKQQKAKSLPTISGFYKHQEQLNVPDFNFFNPNIVGLSLKLPVFSSGMRCSKVQQTKLELEKATNMKNYVSRQLEVGVLRAKSDIKTAYEKYENEKENLKLSEKIYNQYLEKIKEGVSSGMELTQAQNQYLSTQANYIAAMVELLNAKNKLDKALNNY